MLFRERLWVRACLTVSVPVGNNAFATRKQTCTPLQISTTMASLRLIQTSDWHFGQQFGTVEPSLASRLRQARADAVEQVLQTAERTSADLVLVAGDQFDGSMPERCLVDAMLQQVAAHSDVSVHMIPGNHDPCEPGSVYDCQYFAREKPPNLHLHRKYEPISLPGHGATLFPCPCVCRFGDRDPMDWIPARRADDGWRIGLAHGSLPWCADPGHRNFPIADDAPSRFDLDYVALGDWHSPTPDPSERPHERMYYAGSPEIGGWDEMRGGYALEVVLDSKTGSCATAHRVGRFEWSELSVELYTADDLHKLQNRLTALASPTRLLRVLARGILSPSDQLQLEQLASSVARLFAQLSVRSDDIRTNLETDDHVPQDPWLREVHRRLLKLTEDQNDGLPKKIPRDLCPIDAEIARRALGRFLSYLP
ncbi:MAG: exonuclease SbcCD subunit D [Isosphaerales bacterium]